MLVTARPGPCLERLAPDPKGLLKAMAQRPIPKLTTEQREADNLLSKHVLRVARPFFWHVNKDNIKGGSAFILQFERGYVAVTCNHVLEQYEQALKRDAQTICQLGKCQVRPERSLIARDERLDIATFQVSQSQIKQADVHPVDCRNHWPPPEVAKGDAIKLIGFLDETRTADDMPAWGALAVADEITDKDIITIYDPKIALVTGLGVPKPPIGLNMSGCSGGPCFLVKVKRLMAWYPVGMIYRGPRKVEGVDAGEFASFDQIRIRRLHFLRSDGTIEDEGGWLPN